MKMQEYLALPAWSAGDLERLLAECPAAAWAGSAFNKDRPVDVSEVTDFGTIAHSIVCERDRSILEVIDPNDYPAKTTGAIPIGWTNKDIRAARDAVRMNNKIPILLPDVKLIDGMTEAVTKYIELLRAYEPAVWAAYRDGIAESTIEWVDPVGNLRCKARPDILAPDYSIVLDFKFTERSAEPESYAQTMIMRSGGMLRAAFYRRALRLTKRVEAPTYIFIVTEQQPPHLSSAIGLDPRGVEIGDQRVEMALSMLADCAQRNTFDAYPARVVYPEVPAWAESRWLEKQVAAGIPYDPAKLFERTDR